MTCLRASSSRPRIRIWSMRRLSSSDAPFVSPLVQFDEGGFPAPPYGAHVDPEQFGHLGLLPAVVEQQADHLALLVRQLPDPLVKGAPAFEVVRGVRPV